MKCRAVGPRDGLFEHAELLHSLEAAEDDPRLRSEAYSHDGAVLEAQLVHGLVRVSEGIDVQLPQRLEAAHNGINRRTFNDTNNFSQSVRTYFNSIARDLQRKNIK